MGDVGVAEQRHLGTPGRCGVCQRIQIVFYAVHMTVGVKDHHAVKGGKAVGGFQCTVIAVARHRVGPQLGVQRQSQFQIPQAVAQKDQGIDAFALFHQHALNGGTSAVAVAQNQKLCHKRGPPLLPFT